MVFCCLCSIQDTALPTFDKESVFLRMLASPINPADINMVEGNHRLGMVASVGWEISVSLNYQDLHHGFRDGEAIQINSEIVMCQG